MARFNEMINSDKLVLIDFFAEWCGPCKMMKPILQDLKSKKGDEIIIYKIDIDKNPKLASDYSIQGVPTLVLFKKGKEVWRQAGVIPVFKILPILDKYAV